MEWSLIISRKKCKKKYYAYTRKSLKIKIKIWIIYDSDWKSWFSICIKLKEIHPESLIACKLKLNKALIVDAWPIYKKLWWIQTKNEFIQRQCKNYCFFIYVI